MTAATVAFERVRPQLFRVAYGILGSVAEAEEVVQDSWLRLRHADIEAIESLPAWLKTVVARLSLDSLASARRKRESYVGEWLPEPLVSGLDEDDVEGRIALEETVAAALRLMLGRLSPAERIAFLLHDAFGMPFAEISEMVGASPGAVRQQASRARRNLEAAQPRYPVDREEQQRLVLAFAIACASGEVEQLVGLLDPSVVFRSDGGGRVTAARVPIRGAERAARGLIALTRTQAGDEAWARFAIVNGGPGIVSHDGAILTVISFGFDCARIVAVDSVRNPDKLAHVLLPEGGIA